MNFKKDPDDEMEYYRKGMAIFTVVSIAFCIVWGTVLYFGLVKM